MEMSGQFHASSPLPPLLARYLLCRSRLGARAWTGAENVRTVHPAAIRCTGYSVPALTRPQAYYLLTHRADFTKYSVVVLLRMLSNVFQRWLISGILTPGFCMKLTSTFASIFCNPIHLPQHL
jgi:hypothetical protein